MGIYESVKQLSESFRNEQILLVLHTSCVLENTYSLRLINSLDNVSVSVPNSVFYELQLLKHSVNIRFAKNASLILSELCGDRIMRYDIEQFYQNCYSFTDISDLHSGITVFGFYDHSVAEEFMKYFFSRRRNSVYVFSFDPYGFNKDFDGMIPLSGYSGFFSSKDPFLCKCIPVPNSVPVSGDPVNGDMLRVTASRTNSPDVKYISGNSLRLIAGGIGGEAKVYASAELPGKVIKCYTKYYPSKEKTEKLYDLIALGNKIGSGNIAMPTELVFNSERRCIGFSMPELSGKALSNIYYNELWDKYNRNNIIRRLALLLIELRLYRLNVVDLSGNNVRIGENDRVFIIDCDSFETFRFPGNGYTPPYGSPDLLKDKLDIRLREPHQNNFEFAVLLFQCMLGWENPLTQKNMGDKTPEWGVFQFPYEYDSHVNAAASKFDRWMMLDEDLRKAFADEFHFRRWHSIGAWLKALKL